MVAGDDRFILHRHTKRLGVVGNADRAIRMLPSDSQIVCFADQDDLWAPDKIERFCHAFETDAGLNLIHSDMALIDDDDIVLEPSCFDYQRRSVDDSSPPALLIRSVVTGCAMAARADLLRRALPLPTAAVPTVYHDRWIALVAALENSVGVLNVPLTQYRQHDRNQVGAVSPAERGAHVRRAPLPMLRQAWAERRATLDALDAWSRNPAVLPAVHTNLHPLLSWRNRWQLGLWRYGLALRARSWVDRRAALGLAIGRLFQS